MSKFAILADLHFGARNDSPVFHRYFERFFNFFFAYLKTENINTVFQLGDIFDRRKYVNFRTLAEAKRIFFDPMGEQKIQFNTLPGNHDIALRESVSINSPSLLLQEYTNIHISVEPTIINFDGTSIDMLPWICKENERDILHFIEDSRSDLCFGHLELKNFPVYRGVDALEGMSGSLFEKYELVVSGHYHTKSRKDNILYAGTPYELTWHDHDDPKGFYIFDTDTRDLEFIRNPFSLFKRMEYNNGGEIVNDLKDCFVKVVVVNKNDPVKFDHFMNELHQQGCYDIKIVEDMSEYVDGNINEEIDLEDTMDVLSNYVESIETETNKEKIKLFLKSLYLEALNQGV